MSTPPTMSVGVPSRFPNGSMNGLLVRVLAKQNVSVVYQPMVDITNDQTLGYEALARPVQGTSEVASFFQAAEKLGVVKDLDSLCRRAAVVGARELPQELFLSINLTTDIVMTNPEMDTAATVELIDSQSMKPERIILEVQPPASQYVSFLKACQIYRQKRLRIAVAGIEPEHEWVFAPGAIDCIKLARRVAQRIEEPEIAAFVRKAAEFGKQENVTVVAEGIETAEMKQAFVDLGITVGQGFFIALPSPLELFLQGQPAST